MRFVRYFIMFINAQQITEQYNTQSNIISPPSI